MGKTIEELMAEKKRIEEQIRALKCKEAFFKRARFGLVPASPTDCHGRPVVTEDVWCLSLKSITDKKDRWQSIIKGTNRQEVIDAIPEFIADLTGIYNMLKEIDKEEK